MSKKDDEKLWNLAIIGVYADDDTVGSAGLFWIVVAVIAFVGVAVWRFFA